MAVKISLQFVNESRRLDLGGESWADALALVELLGHGFRWEGRAWDLCERALELVPAGDGTVATHLTLVAEAQEPGR